MSDQDPRVPAEVEEYLVGLNAAAGELGGRIGGGLGGALGGGAAAAAGGRGGARGGARAARRLKTVVEERAGTVPGGWDEIVERLRAGLPEAGELGREADLVRLSVPLGRTGLQHVVVDVRLHAHDAAPAGPACDLELRAFGKEGLLNRKPTAKTADRAWAAVTAAQDEERYADA